MKSSTIDVPACHWCAGRGWFKTLAQSQNSAGRYEVVEVRCHCAGTPAGETRALSPAQKEKKP